MEAGKTQWKIIRFLGANYGWWSTRKIADELNLTPNQVYKSLVRLTQREIVMRDEIWNEVFWKLTIPARSHLAETRPDLLVVMHG